MENPGTSYSQNLDDDFSITCTPEEISDKAKEVTLNLLPEKSKERYNMQYNLFMDWCHKRNIKKYSENVMLAYFSELSEKYKSSTLWSTYSMLKSTLLTKVNIDIGKFARVQAFLKKKSKGHIPKKSRVFTYNEVNTFLRTAPEETYLLAKVALIIGIAGACRCNELTHLTVDNVIDKDDIIIIHVADTKNNSQRTFTICNSVGENYIDVLAICKRYLDLRPKEANSRRLFLKYHNGKCINQNVGYHSIGALPGKIAAFLDLPHAQEYTGHCFRRTSATLLADSGADILTLKRHGGWKSSTVAEGYVEDSLENKISTAKRVLTTNITPDTTHTQVASSNNGMDPVDDSLQFLPIPNQKPSLQSQSLEQVECSNLSKQGISFVHCSLNNPVFNINISTSF